ncbi:MAG: hypothetical protein GY799_31305 [Desulfobulbaceae bacterium]|nr:hypothetical protein [Desulfobulbaceae bacterium]
MDEQKNKNQTRVRARRGSNTFQYFAITIVVLLVIVFYFYMQKSVSNPPINQAKDTSAMEQENLPSPDPTTTSSIREDGDLSSTDSNTPKSQGRINPIDSLTQNVEPEVEPAASSDAETSSDPIQQSLPPNSNPQDLIKEINSFYTHLDQQPYMQGFGLKESSKLHFSKLLQKLVNNPPVVIRETDDLFTLLQNTAHFFRIIGKENIIILKGILSNEQNSFEKILETYYALTYQPKYLKKEYSLSIPPDALTDYAAFFLNTMGGRLYLFRRDSTSRMVVSYYAIVTIDRANLAGNGGHGIDIRPAILSLIEEIEIGGSRLQLREQYLDTLYDLQVKYQ